jgi:hypothetical protein
MASLTITDNANSTGATASITGSAGGSNQVYVQNVDGQLGSGVWTLAGTRTGDGTVALTLTKGYYWGHCLTNGTVLSGFCFFQVTDGLDAVLDRCVSAVKAQAQLLNLPCTQRVYDFIHSDTPLVQYPCIILTTEGARQTDEKRLNGRDDIGHPVRMLVKDLCLKFDEKKRKEYRKWRQAFFRAYHNQRLPGIIESVMNKVELGEITAASMSEPQMICELTVRCITREVRGLGA